MSFHVVLPSNSSMKLYPDNVLSDFRVKLAKPIALDRPYQVALEEIIYPRIHQPVPPQDAWIEGNFGDSAKTSKNRYRVHFSAQDDTKRIIDNVNIITKDHGWQLAEDKSSKMFFEYTKDDEGSPKRMKLNPSLAYMLGYGDGSQSVEFKQKLEPAHFPSPLFDLNCQMYVYTDFVDHQRVGDSLVPLLRIVVAQPSETKLVSEKYIRPYYTLVTKNYIEEIRIQVRNHAGDIFPFPKGAPLVVKLHFQPL